MTKEMFIQISDFKLFAKLSGENNGKPTIVMDAGYGGDSKVWDPIISDISMPTEVLIYDRAGLGKSEKSSNPRTSREIVKELNELLNKAKINRPYILVGHSFGGLNMRLYATEFPKEVAGLILVDSTPEEYIEKFLPSMSKEFQKAYYKQFVYESNYDEFLESFKQIKESRRQLNVPLIVLSAGKKDHYSRKSQELWNEMQKEIFEISSHSELIIAENSAHYVQNDEPDLVIDAIERMIEKT